MAAMAEGSAARKLEFYPQYRLRYGSDWVEIWQVPCEVTPHLEKPLRIGGLAGKNYGLMQGIFLRWLKKAGVRLGSGGEVALDEDTAVQLGLLCKAIAPMRRVERIVQVAQAIDEMRQPEAAYWLGMALYRFNPRRVMAALRMLVSS